MKRMHYGVCIICFKKKSQISWNGGKERIEKNKKKTSEIESKIGTWKEKKIKKVENRKKFFVVDVMRKK